MEVSFEGLQGADLVVDTVYKGGKISGKGSEVLSKLLPNCSNSGGFRKVMRKDGSGMPAYVVLYSSMQELAWPDYLDEETGIVEINLDFFARQEGDMYRRSNECFCERPYDSAEIQILLERAGMELVTIYDDMTFSPASPENERWVVVAKKMRKETDRRGA